MSFIPSYGNGPMHVPLRDSSVLFFQVFFHKVNYLIGCVRLSEDYCDHVWVTKEEMEDLVEPEYYKTLKSFLS